MAISPFAYPKLPRKKSVFNYLRHTDIARNGTGSGYGSSAISVGRKAEKLLRKRKTPARNTERLAGEEKIRTLKTLPVGADEPRTLDDQTAPYQLA